MKVHLETRLRSFLAYMEFTYPATASTVNRVASILTRLGLRVG